MSAGCVYTADAPVAPLTFISLPRTCMYQMVAAKGSQQTIIKQAVDDLLTYVPAHVARALTRLTHSPPCRLNGVKYYLKCSNYDQKQINAFATCV